MAIAARGLQTALRGLPKTDAWRTATLCLIGAWIVIGLVGRDPWKPDEAYSFGLVNHIARTGEWVVPTLAGEPFMEKPPLFFVSAALCVRLFAGALAPPDAARLATGLYVALTILFAALAARELHGNDRGLACALVLIGCVGYGYPAHLLITDNAFVAGIAIALYGLAIILHRRVAGALALGTGAGVAFMAKGLLGPGIIGATALALAYLPAWRTRGYLRSLIWAGAAFSPWALLWPSLLYGQSPELFREWLILNNLGRYTGAVQLGPERDHLMYLKVLPWFALPALPLAAWQAFGVARTGPPPWRRPEVQLPLVMAGAMLLVLSAAATMRPLYALPMLIPLAVLAAARATEPPRWLTSGLHRIAIAAGAGLALGLWALWLALALHWPAGIADRLEAARPGFVLQVQPADAWLALGATAGWIWLVRASRQRSDPVPLAWAASAALTLILGATLWLSYLDFGNSYRSMFAELQGHVPSSMTCMARRDLGEPQRALLEYFSGIVAQQESPASARRCDVLLVQGSKRPAEAALPEYWTLLWSGSRPGDNNERYWLLQQVR